MLTEKEKTRTSKFLSLVLRHKPEEIGITLDSAGWTFTADLIQRINAHGHKITKLDLIQIVEFNDKKRFEFNNDNKLIRASQGHSVDIDPGYKPIEPPELLYHGTSTIVVDNILRTGINKGSRTYVHLSDNKNTAINVGSRHGKPVVLIIKAKEMYDQGIKFYLSTNKVWLTDFVPSKFIDKTPLY